MTTNWQRYVRAHPRTVDLVVALLLFADSGPGSRLGSADSPGPTEWWPAVLRAVIACTALLFLRRGYPRTTLALTATAAICADQDLSTTRVLILTTFEIDEYVARALTAGASGFLGKDVGADELLAGIRTVASGDALLSPMATRVLISRFLSAPEPGTSPAAPEHLAALTAREREVMALAAEGQSNHEIAEKLFVSPLTVRTHVHRAMTKLNARDRAQLVVVAYQSGLVRPTPPPR